jgi:hypothetical protein
MLIIETVGGILLGMSAIGFILLAALDKPLQAWVGAALNRGGTDSGIPSIERPQLANVATLESGPAEERRLAA